jgi:hypothetical protein
MHVSLDKSMDDESTTYWVRVKYTYTVDGIRHDGSRIAFGYAATSVRDDHEQIYHTLKDAKSVKVRYSLSEPSLSCLSAGSHRGIRLDFAFVLGWLSSCFWAILLWWVSQGSDIVLLDNLLIQ